jgi:hypothetical protein
MLVERRRRKKGKKERNYQAENPNFSAKVDIVIGSVLFSIM